MFNRPKSSNYSFSSNVLSGQDIAIQIWVHLALLAGFPAVKIFLIVD
jgi:hypothetical protein